MSYEVPKFVKPKREDWDNGCEQIDSADAIAIFRHARCNDPLGQAVTEFIFSRSASAAMPGDNRRMAATAEEGTARKHVSPVNARTQRKSMFKGDSRKDGRLANTPDQRRARQRRSESETKR